VQRERWAVTALFFSNGASFPSVLPRLPEIKAELGLTDGELGLALLGVGVGGLAGSIVSRWLLPRLGARRLAVGTTVALALLLPLVGLAPSRWVLFAVLLGVGMNDALTDVAMNVSGIEVQRRMRRPVLNGMHAAWSVGAATAAVVGSLAAALDVPLPAHLAVVGLLLAVLGASVRSRVPDHHGAGDAEREPGVRVSKALVLLCGLAVLAALLEDAPGSWSAVYLSDHTGAATGVAGLGFTAFTVAMFVGRLVGDRVVERYGLVPTVRAGAAAATVALGGALVLDTTWAGVAAFAVVGAGAATLFPALFTAAGNLPGQGVAAMNTAARIGFLASPPVVGAVADAVGLPLALGLLVVPAALGVAVLAGAVRPRG
jgi:MFS family permease